MSMMSWNIPKPPPRKLTAPQKRVMDAVKKHGVYICHEGYRPALCAHCLQRAEGNYSIHRDGFGVGPEVDLCDKCGQYERPTCEEIWESLKKKTAEK